MDDASWHNRLAPTVVTLQALQLVTLRQRAQHSAASSEARRIQVVPSSHLIIVPPPLPLERETVPVPWLPVSNLALRLPGLTVAVAACPVTTSNPAQKKTLRSLRI